MTLVDSVNRLNTVPGEFSPDIGRCISFSRGSQVRGSHFLGISRVIQGALAHRLRLDGMGLFLLGQLVLRVLERGERVVTLSSGDGEGFPPRLGVEFLQERLRRLRLRCLLCGHGALDRIVDRQQEIAFPDLGALSDQHLRDGAGDLGIDVDVFALGLNALDDSVGINSLGIGICGGIEGLIRGPWRRWPSERRTFRGFRSRRYRRSVPRSTIR